MGKKVDNILASLKEIRLGDLLGVLWLDAATVKDADVRKLPLPNEYVETRRYTPGIYVCVQKGATWHIPTLIILRDQIDEIRAEIRSIPIPLVMKVRRLGVKTPETLKKASRVLKKLSRAERRIIRLRGSGVKILD